MCATRRLEGVEARAFRAASTACPVLARRAVVTRDVILDFENGTRIRA
jgi:hypothetical protein